jgi:predicted Fe-S protein YdhL (DUF1289 family)
MWAADIQAASHTAVVCEGCMREREETTLLLLVLADASAQLTLLLPLSFTIHK